MSLPSSRILRLITPNILVERRSVLLLMRWRIVNQQYYATQPKITEDSFQKWLIENVFRKNRLLFWVLDKSGIPIGHMGLNQFKKDSCEIDNVLRGVPREKGRMGEALLALIRWTFKSAPIKNVFLRVLSDNDHAIKFYKRNGFIPVRLVPVSRGSKKRFLKMRYEHSHSF